MPPDSAPAQSCAHVSLLAMARALGYDECDPKALRRAYAEQCPQCGATPTGQQCPASNTGGGCQRTEGTP